MTKLKIETATPDKINPELVGTGELPQYIIDGVIRRVLNKLFRHCGLPRTWDLEDLRQTLYAYFLELKIDPDYPKYQQVAYIERSVLWRAYANLYDRTHKPVKNSRVSSVTFSALKFPEAFLQHDESKRKIDEFERQDSVQKVLFLAKNLSSKSTFDIFRRHFLDGKPRRELAEELGVTVTAISKRIEILTHRLKQTIQEE